MPYATQISRANPTCFVFLVDQFGSMDEKWGGSGAGSKALEVSRIMNRMLKEMSLKCAAGHDIRDYFHIAVLGYGKKVSSAFIGPLLGKELVPISEIANNPDRIEEITRSVSDGAGGLVQMNDDFPVWFDPKAEGGTPMCEALTMASGIIGGWLRKHPDSYPPVVINITDGAVTDGDPTAASDALKTLSSVDGNVLFFNIHISSIPGGQELFPCSEQNLQDDYGRLLYKISSVLPDVYIPAAQEQGFTVRSGARAFCFQADMVQLIKFLNVGTRTSRSLSVAQAQR